ncbi:MAG: conjugal transfer protein TraX [Defluviitaleaceae bacterium]|nr:conjugal transfer protein TraX [Defluviitaleaceae bacterium]
MNAFTLKIIALVAMFIDHIGIVMPEFFGLSPGMNIFRVIGRVSFPIFVYLIAEGFRHTKSPEKFLLRLGAFAVISQIPFDLAFNAQINFLADTNIFYTLFLGGAAIFAYDYIARGERSEPYPRHRGHVSRATRSLKTGDSEFPKGWRGLVAFLPACAFLILAEVFSADYGGYGVAFIFFMYLIKPLKWRLAAMASLCLWQYEGTIRAIFEGHDVPAIFIWMIPVTLIPVVFFALYNGKRGPGLKWLFYAAYPAHLLILFAVVSWVL